MIARENKIYITNIIIAIVTTCLASPLVVALILGSCNLGMQYGKLNEKLDILEKELNTDIPSIKKNFDEIRSKAERLEKRLNNAELQLKTLVDSFTMKLVQKGLISNLQYATNS